MTRPVLSIGDPAFLSSATGVFPFGSLSSSQAWAISTRQLTAVAGGVPTGAIVQIQRTSDFAIGGFTASQIEDGTLEAWVGAGNNGNMFRMKDQASGAWVGSSWGTPLPIVVNGQLVRVGGKPAFQSPPDGQVSVINLTSNNGWFPVLGNPMAFQVRQASVGGWAAVSPVDHQNQNQTAPALVAQWFDSSARVYGPNPNTLNGNTRYLESFEYGNGSGSVYMNGNLIGSNSYTLTSPPPGSMVTSLGRSKIDAGYITTTGTFQELILFADKTGYNRSAIEAEINAYYGIY